jgi:hypothetical protein
MGMTPSSGETAGGTVFNGLRFTRATAMILGM